MVVRKIAIDNSFRYNPISEKTKETVIKPKKIKTGSRLREQNKHTSQNNRKFLKKVIASGLATRTK